MTGGERRRVRWLAALWVFGFGQGCQTAPPEAPPPPAPPPAVSLSASASVVTPAASSAPPSQAWVASSSWPKANGVDKALALGLLETFSDRDPRPIRRGWATLWHVQFRSENRQMSQWWDARAELPHTRLKATKTRQKCSQKVSVGHAVKGRIGSIEVKRRRSFDEVLVGKGKPTAVKLPKGRFHEGCLGPEGDWAWLSWSTPMSPPSLLAVSLRKGHIKPLRLDGRPGLGPLGLARASWKPAPARVELRATDAAKAPEFLLPVPQAALGAWHGLARYLAARGRIVWLVGFADVAAALEKSPKPLWVVHQNSPSAKVFLRPSGNVVMGAKSSSLPVQTTLYIGPKRPISNTISHRFCESEAQLACEAESWAALATLERPKAGKN